MECWRAVLQDTSGSIVPTEHGASLLLPAPATLSMQTQLFTEQLWALPWAIPTSGSLTTYSFYVAHTWLHGLVSFFLGRDWCSPQQSLQTWYCQLSPGCNQKNPLVQALNIAARSLQSNSSFLPVNTLGAPSLPLVTQDTDQLPFLPLPLQYFIFRNIRRNHSKNKLLLTEMKNKKIALFTTNDHSQKGRNNQNKGTWLMALDDHWTAYQINGK